MLLIALRVLCSTASMVEGNRSLTQRQHSLRNRYHVTILWGCYGGRRQRLVRDDQRLEEHVQGVVKELVNAETVNVL